MVLKAFKTHDKIRAAMKIQGYSAAATEAVVA
jgi:hypothetical protein